MEESDTSVFVGYMPPVYLGCGHYKWACRFRLSNPASKDGWIIQELKQRNALSKSAMMKLQDKLGVPPPDSLIEVSAKEGVVVVPADPPIHYWEAWPVSRDSNEVDIKKMGITASQASDDEYEEHSRAGTRGTSRVCGWLKFFHGELPSDFKRYNPATHAARLPSTATKPSFWSRKNASRHHLFCIWDCITVDGRASIRIWTHDSKGFAFTENPPAPDSKTLVLVGDPPCNEE